MSDDQTQMIVFCEGCGEAVVLRIEDGATTRSRETDPAAPDAGRVTITQGDAGTVVHTCAPGAFVPPDRKAPPQR
jgi:hypothetical protein